jgi:hypothetical protein
MIGGTAISTTSAADAISEQGNDKAPRHQG